jgi:hypothetical protein
VKVGTLEKNMIRRVFFVTQFANFRVIFTSTTIDVSPAREQEGENEPGSVWVGFEDEWKDPEFSSTPELIRAVASWDVAVTVEAELSENDAVRLSFGREGRPLLKNLPFETPFSNLTPDYFEPACPFIPICELYL